MSTAQYAYRALAVLRSRHKVYTTYRVGLLGMAAIGTKGRLRQAQTPQHDHFLKASAELGWLFGQKGWIELFTMAFAGGFTP